MGVTVNRMVVFALAALGVVGCASPEQIAAQDDAQCRSYGVRPGMPQYVNCRMMLANQRDARSARASDALMSTGLQMMQNSQPRPTTTTICNRTHTGVICNSN